MLQYNYFDHNSPINQPGGKNDTFARLNINPAINDHQNWLVEAIASGGPAGGDIYGLMYEDSDSSWGHRQGVLGYISDLDNNPGHFTWIGIGIATDNKSKSYSTIDLLDDSTKTTKYTPPATADTRPPTMDPPTIVVGANMVRVTNVRNDSDGSTSGVVGVTGVVFYVGSAVDKNGQFLTVVATKDTNTPVTWTATLSATDPTTLHAVAVDGSGNYTDTAG